MRSNYGIVHLRVSVSDTVAYQVISVFVSETQISENGVYQSQRRNSPMPLPLNFNIFKLNFGMLTWFVYIRLMFF